MTRPIASNSKPPAVVWPPVDSGGLVPVLAARRQMVLSSPPGVRWCCCADTSGTPPFLHRHGPGRYAKPRIPTIGRFTRPVEPG